MQLEPSIERSREHAGRFRAQKNKTTERKRIWLPAFLFLFHLLFSIIAIAIFGRTFQFGKRMMLLHVFLVAGLICLLIVLFAFLVLTEKLGRTVTRLLFSLTATLCFSALVLLYITNFFANKVWGDNLSYDLVAHNISHLSSYLRAVAINPLGPYLAVALGFLLILLVYWKLSAGFVIAIEECVSVYRSHGIFGNRKRKLVAASVVLLALLTYAGSLGWLLSKVRGAGADQSEPIISFFAPGFFTFNPARDSLPPEEQQIRTQYSAPRTFERKNVIVIIVDALRADRTQVYGYEKETTPFLRKLADDGRLRKVKLAAANCPFSTCGILATMTSRSVERLNSEHLKLYDLLHDVGFKVYLILSGDHTNWGRLRTSYGRSIDYYFDGVMSKRYPPTDDRLLFEGLEPIPAYYGAPSFFYFHLMSTHSIGVQFGPQKFQPANSAGFPVVRPKDIPALNNSYDNRVLQADETIRQLFDGLARKGYLQNSVIIILADHGESLGEHNIFGHTTHLYQEDISIPLLIYDDPEVSYENLEFATQIDVAPTIFDRLGLPIPSIWEGSSLLKPSRNPYSYHQGFRRLAFRAAVIYRTPQAVYKYIYAPGDRKEELYELLSDPKESHNLILTTDSRLIANMRNKMAEHGVVPVP